MAKIERWYRCPGCKAAHGDIYAAERCAASHVYSEVWAVSREYPSKAVMVTKDKSEAQALIEAEMKD